MAIPFSQKNQILGNPRPVQKIRPCPKSRSILKKIMQEEMVFTPKHCESIERMRTVYPGHPVLIAMQIMVAFDSPEEALKKTKEGWPAALSHSKVRGAGGAVYQGLSVIERLVKSPGQPEEAFDWGAEMWRRSRESGDCRDALEEGEQSAKERRDEFIQMALIWMATEDEEDEDEDEEA